jgi:glutamyl-tRNA reductase
VASITLIHFKKGENCKSLGFSSPHPWSTCLREIHILEGDITPAVGGEVFRDWQAVRFLVEVVCGLHSPILGETEVFGQFRTWLESLPDSHPLCRDQALIPFILRVAKETRSKFLVGQGSKSYGKIVRRWVRPYKTCVLWGHGSLGRQIFPWIKEKTLAVMVRSPRVIDCKIPFQWQNPPTADVHVIAAPIDSQWIHALQQQASLIIDLRENGIAGEGVLNLEELFRTVQADGKSVPVTLQACREWIRVKTEAQSHLQTHRPFGWEDLCM